MTTLYAKRPPYDDETSWWFTATGFCRIDFARVRKWGWSRTTEPEFCHHGSRTRLAIGPFRIVLHRPSSKATAWIKEQA